MASLEHEVEPHPFEEDVKGALGKKSELANIHDLRLFLYERGIYPIPDKTFGFGLPSDKDKTRSILRKIGAPQRIQEALAKVA